MAESLALVPIDVPEILPMGPGLTVIAPSGHRVEGLAFGQVAALLRELA